MVLENFPGFSRWKYDLEINFSLLLRPSPSRSHSLSHSSHFLYNFPPHSFPHFSCHSRSYPFYPLASLLIVPRTPFLTSPSPSTSFFPFYFLSYFSACFSDCLPLIFSLIPLLFLLLFIPPTSPPILAHLLSHFSSDFTSYFLSHLTFHWPANVPTNFPPLSLLF